MEFKAGDISKIAIFAFILIVGLLGTYLEFRKPKNKNQAKEFKNEDFNKIIKEEIKKEEKL